MPLRGVRYLFIKMIYVIIDVIFLCLAVYLALHLRSARVAFDISPHSIFLDVTNPFQFIFVLWICVVPMMNGIHSLYQTRREVFESVEIWYLMRSLLIASMIVLTAIFALKIQGFPRSVFGLMIVLSVIFLSCWRIAKRWFVEYIVARGYNNFNVLIIGGGRVGSALATEIEKRPGFGLRIVGFLDDFRKEPVDNKYPVLGPLKDFLAIARKEFIHEIFITIHHDSQVFYKLIEDARDRGIAVRVVPQAYDLMTGDVLRYNIGFIPVMEYCDKCLLKGRQTGKRLFDFFASIVIAAMLSPLLLLIVILIRLDSKGPAIYVSRRYGLGGKILNMYKFRSMVRDADAKLTILKKHNEADGPIFKIRNDPRITRVGAILRRYSLDELPQIFNVIKGDMSLVGPRPLPIDQIDKDDQRQLKRLEVRPGMTGLWQVRGRSDLSFERFVKWDIWYINNWSFMLDMSILLQTLPVVVKGKGAY